MALVKIKFAPTYIPMVTVDQVRDHLQRGLYVTESALFQVNVDGEDAAEEVFDLTNNPSRQDERMKKYGNGRSLSTGDIVEVGEEQWLCMSFGWASI